MKENIPTLKQTIMFLSVCETPLGDLCNDILTDEHFPFENIENAWNYMNDKIIQCGSNLDAPVRRLKTIYKTILNS